MIPKTIHYCWFGRNPKPKLAEKCIASWKKYCPDYEIIEWNEDNIDINSMPDFVKETYQVKKWGFVPDYIRLWLVYNYGGIYLDTDVEVIKDLDSLLGNEAFAGFEDEQRVALGLGFGAEKGNQTIKLLMTAYESRKFIKQDGTYDTTPAPHFEEDIYCKLGLIQNGSFQKIPGMTIYPEEYFCPLNYYTNEMHKTKNTMSIHWYMGSWQSKEQKKKNKKDNAYIKRKKTMHALLHLPNKLLMTIFGPEKYQKLKDKLKK